MTDREHRESASTSPSGSGSGLALLLDRGWGQEVVHQLVLRELLGSTDLAARLDLWTGEALPGVLYEPLRGLFDLGLVQGDAIRVLIELKATTEVGEGQRRRQEERAQAMDVLRAYILLGPGFWVIGHEAGVRYIGVPELEAAVSAVASSADGAIGDLARAYASRLARDSAAWSADLDSGSAGTLDLLRTYSDIAAAWPIDVHPYRVTNRAGPDWILNANAWTRPDLPGWDQAQVYWELVNGRVRFKVEWLGAIEDAMPPREAFRQALEAASTETGIAFRATRLGMTLRPGPTPERETML